MTKTLSQIRTQPGRTAETKCNSSDTSGNGSRCNVVGYLRLLLSTFAGVEILAMEFPMKIPASTLIVAVFVLSTSNGRDAAEASPLGGKQTTAGYWGSIVRVDNRLYRHCHVVGSRARVVCKTADPWSPEHMELDRRQGRFNHEGGPNDTRWKRQNQVGRFGL